MGTARTAVMALILLGAGVFAGCSGPNGPEPASEQSSTAATNRASLATNVPSAETNATGMTDVSGAATNAAPAPAAAEDEPEAEEEVAVIKTGYGTMVVEFWPDAAPKTVENFKKLARDGFYNGTAFHRVVEGFMIQGGDPLTKDPAQEESWGTGNPGYTINAEFNDRPHERGVISMARGMSPNSAGSQFFICLERQPGLDRNYTVFGKLIKGEDVLTKIGSVPVKLDPSQREKSRPVTRVHVESIDIVPRDSIEQKN